MWMRPRSALVTQEAKRRVKNRALGKVEELDNKWSRQRGKLRNVMKMAAFAGFTPKVSTSYLVLVTS
jgi:hypothetical protein